MEKKNIIYEIGGCCVQEMEHEKDLCCDVEIRKKLPMWINKWNANTVHSSVTSVQLQRICCMKKYTFFWSNIKYRFFFFQDGAWFHWNGLKSFSIPRWCQSSFLLKHPDVIFLAITPSLLNSRPHPHICPSLSHGIPSLFSGIFSEPHCFISILSVLQAYITFLLTFSMSSLIFCLTPDLELEGRINLLHFASLRNGSLSP